MGYCTKAKPTTTLGCIFLTDKIRWQWQDMFVILPVALYGEN